MKSLAANRLLIGYTRDQTCTGAGMLMSGIAAIVCVIACLHSTKANADTLDVTVIKAAVNRSLPLIESSSAEYLEQRTCFSCHHQAMSILVLTEAKQHGFMINEDNLKRQVERTVEHLKDGRSRYLSGKGTGGQVDTAGHGLRALEAAGHKPDETTAAVTTYLLMRDEDRDYWARTGQRPPTQASHVTSTYVAVRGLDVFATKEQREAAEVRKDKVRAWLKKVTPKDTEDHVSRLRALVYLGEDKELIAASASELLKQQHADGGWAQLSDIESDAYATGTALVALHRAGALRPNDPAYQRGMKYLLDSQLKDGSWHVKTRSKPIQKYFESGFPHGKDQFISMSATCWSTLALIQACPEEAIGKSGAAANAVEVKPKK